MSQITAAPHDESYGSAPAGHCALWPVDLKLTHLDWNPEATLIHFQGQYLTTCELDYNILQGVIQNAPKAPASVDVGEFCLVEDLTSARWYRGRVQSLKKNLYDVFLIDHGNVLSVDEAHISCCSNDLFILPPKIVCGFLSSVLLLSDCCHSVLEQYFANLVGRNVTGYIKALLPHKVLLMEAPDINSDLVHYGFGRHVDTDTFLLLVEMLTEAPLKQNIEPAPDLLIEKQRRQEFFLKPSSLRGYEDILSSFRPKLKCGSHAIVHVTAAVNPGLFYCQMTAKESELKELSSKLAAAVNQLRTSDNPGLLCSVKGKDENWYRGLVQHLPVNSLVRVLFVDYGYFETVRVENIHKLPPDLCSIPIKSFPCALSCMNNEEEAIKMTPTPIQKPPITKHNRQPLVNPKASENCNKEKEASKYELEKTKEPVSLKGLNIKPGCEFAVRCILINTPSDFWCQLLDQVPALESLMERLQGHYSIKTVPLEPEPCCVVKSPSNGKWCRGIITERQNGRANVILVDFGSSIQVSEECLQGLLPEFCVFEKQAFRCSLYNVIEPLALGWTKDATEFLRRFADNSGVNLKCNVVSQLNVKNKGLCNVVDLCNTESNQSVSNLLVEKCLARVVTRTLSPTVFPESFVYSSYGLTERSEEKVFVTHVHSHFEIFCQLEKNTAVFEEIDDKISEVLKLKQTNAETVVEKLCLAKYLDGQWYRGIAYLAQSPSHVFVTFVDYGNTMIAEKKNVVFIPKESTELLNKPMQALRFCLAGVPQGLVFADVKEWLDTAVLNKQVRAIIVAKEEDGSFEVELFDGEVSINDRLKKLIDTLTPKPKIAMTLNIKSERKNMNQNVSKSQLKAKTPMSNRHRQKKNQKSNKRSQNRQTEPVKSQQSKKAEVKQTAVTQDCPSPPEPQSNYAIQDNKKLGQKSKRECFVVLQISCLPVIKLTEGLKLACFASHIDSLSSFFLQRSSDEANIFQMAEDINSSFFKETLEPCTNIALKADDLVIVEYKDDGALYRAVVKENIDSCTFKVEFVDFGNSDIVGNEKMFVMTKDNVSQPRYSIPCSLLDCSAFDDTAAFTDVVMDKPFMVEFVCFRKSQWQVKVEILDATISVPVEAAAPKETDTVPEVKKTTQTKPNITKRVMRERKKKLPKKISIVKVSKDLFSAFLPPKIQKGDTETGLVLSVQSNGDFYLRLDKSEDSLAALETLLAAHLKYCEPVLTNNVKEGLNCLVQEQNGRKWRRAAVKDVFHDACLVHLLDYGKIETASKSTLWQMMRFCVWPYKNLLESFQTAEEMTSSDFYSLLMGDTRIEV
uniref:Tudor domain-containing protein n=1 Tax=Periophthalmus magnuspinnatus TaxID=409849 RepID=A0A3B4B5Z8_9GOBI